MGQEINQNFKPEHPATDQPFCPSDRTAPCDPLQEYRLSNPQSCGSNSSEYSFGNLCTAALYPSDASANPANGEAAVAQSGSPAANGAAASPDAKPKASPDTNQEGHRSDQHPSTTDHSSDAPSPPAGSGDSTQVGAGTDSHNKTRIDTFIQSKYVFHKGDTPESMAKRKLGKNVTDQGVLNYAGILKEIYFLDPSNLPKDGESLIMPGRRADGKFTIDDSDENIGCVVSSDGTNTTCKSLDGANISLRHLHNPERWVRKETGDGSGKTQTIFPNGDQTTFRNDGTSKIEKHLHNPDRIVTEYKGNKPGETHTETKFPDGQSIDSSTDDKGNKIEKFSGGVTKITDTEGNWKTTYSEAKWYQPYESDYDKKSGVITSHFKNGSVSKFFENDKHTETTDTGGTITTRLVNGSVTVKQKDAQGHETSRTLYHYSNGGYMITGEGPKPSDDFIESYDPKSGTTRRQEALGTADQKIITQWANGVTKVEAANGKNYQREANGTEHHWGTENYDVPLCKDRAPRLADFNGFNYGRQQTHPDCVVTLRVENVNASQEFADQVQQQYNNLPPKVREVLEKNGYRVVVGDKMSDINFSYLDTHPRSYPPGEILSNLRAEEDDTRHRIFIAEHFKYQDGKSRKTSGLEDLFRHEAGHAVDKSRGYASNSAAFRSAFEKESEKIPAKERAELNYYLNKEGGPSELWAALFAQINGGNFDTPEINAKLKKYFPLCRVEVQKNLDALNA